MTLIPHINPLCHVIIIEVINLSSLYFLLNFIIGIFGTLDSKNEH